MKHNKRIAILFIVAVFAISSCAKTITWQLNDNITVKLRKGVLTVSGTGAVKGEFIHEGGSGYYIYPWSSYRNEITKVVIGKGITEIGQEAFNNCQIAGIVLSDTVTVIGQLAFAGNQLTEVHIPDSVTVIGESAFYGNNLAEAAISANVTNLGTGAFSNNPLRNFTISNDNSAYISKNGMLLSKDGILVLDYYGLEKNIKIPDGVIAIEDNAFFNKGLTGASISDSVNRIGQNAFSNNLLTNIVIPNSVILVGENAFFNNHLSSVTLSNRLTVIEKGAFWTNKLTRVNIPPSVTTIGEYAFQDNQITIVSVPRNVTEIKGYAFAGNPIININIGNNVDLEDFAFDENFNVVYYLENKTAGTYILGGGSWFKMSNIFARTMELREPAMSGQDIINLQKRLLSLGYSSVGEADGYYGPATEAAIRRLQAATGFSPDGKVNIFLWNYIFDDDNLEKLWSAE